MQSSIITYPNAAISKDAAALKDIHIPSKNIAIYQRDDDSMSHELAQLASQSIEWRANGTLEDILRQVRDELEHYPGLRKDVSALMELFEEITQASSFRLLLATVSTNMCTKFHADVNDLRMLCTYIGPGTLWVPDEAIDQKALRENSRDKEVAIDLQQIQQARTGDVVILKGALYPEASPILHRSPTIEENGERRLLLRIDTSEFLSI